MNKKFAINTYNYNSIISPILFLILGIIFLTNPLRIVKISLLVFCLVVFLLGLLKNLLYYKKPDDKKDVVYGTLYMTISVILAIVIYFAFDEVVVTLFRLGFAVFFAYTGILRFIAAFKMKNKIKLLYVISSLLIILCAVVLAILSDIKLGAIGIFIILYAVIELVGYILNKYLAESGNVQEASVVKEKEEIVPTK